MNNDFLNKIFTFLLFSIGFFLYWGGMLYATNEPFQIKLSGLFSSFLGFGMMLWALFRYEKAK